VEQQADQRTGLTNLPRGGLGLLLSQAGAHGKPKLHAVAVQQKGRTGMLSILENTGLNKNKVGVEN